MIKYLLILSLIICGTNSFAKEGPVFTDNLLDAIALSESSEKDILVIFSADWCKFCKILENDIVKNPKIVENLIICTINVDYNSDLVKTYNVGNIPDYFILHNKIEIKRRVGYKNKQDLIKWINNE